jgi:hypothetical protein
LQLSNSHRSPSAQRLPESLRNFDRMRRKRNNAFCDLALISDTEAEEAVNVSEDYLKLVSADLVTRLPAP